MSPVSIKTSRGHDYRHTHANQIVTINISCTKVDIYLNYIWIDTSSWKLLVPGGIILPEVSVLALTWFIRHIYGCNLRILNNVIKTKVNIPQTGQLWLSCSGLLDLRSTIGMNEF